MPPFRVTVGTIARLAVAWIVLAVLAHLTNVAFHLPALVARGLAATLGALGLPAGVSGTTVFCRGTTFEIIEDCTGLSLVAAVAAFAIALPVSAAQRARGAALLGALALLWNALRLVGLALLGASAPRLVPFVHDVLWQLLTVGLAVLAAALWTRAALRVREAT